LHAGVWPVSTIAVEHPAAFATRSVALLVPAVGYTWLTVGVVVVRLDPSPKDHA